MARVSQSHGAGVDAFLAALDHPHRAEILALRAILLAADPAIGEEIKWNAPSFRTSQHFATMQLRAKSGVLIILHFGARPCADLRAGVAIEDPDGLLRWLAPDRASVTFRDMGEVEAHGAAFTQIIRQWIRYV
jgi:hypothetical protein